MTMRAVDEDSRMALQKEDHGDAAIADFGRRHLHVRKDRPEIQSCLHGGRIQCSSKVFWWTNTNTSMSRSTQSS